MRLIINDNHQNRRVGGFLYYFGLSETRVAYYYGATRRVATHNPRRLRRLSFSFATAPRFGCRTKDSARASLCLPAYPLRSELTLGAVAPYANATEPSAGRFFLGIRIPVYQNKKRPPLRDGRSSVAAEQGFEPQQTAPEAVVLPLHHSAPSFSACSGH